MSETAKICGSRGPRIGSEGQPICKREPGHQGEHCPSLDDGWGDSMSWSDPWRDPRPVTAAVPLVERLAEVLMASVCVRGPLRIERNEALLLTSAEALPAARALLPVVEQAVAEALREAAEDFDPMFWAGGTTFVRKWLRDRAGAIATTEGAP